MTDSNGATSPLHEHFPGGTAVLQNTGHNEFVSLPLAWEDVPDWLRRNGWKCETEEGLYAWEDQDGRRYGRWDAYHLQAARMGFDTADIPKRPPTVQSAVRTAPQRSRKQGSGVFR